MFSHTPILCYQTVRFAEPAPSSLLVVRAECIIKQNPSKVNMLPAAQTPDAHQQEAGFRHTGRVTTMPNIPFNRGMIGNNTQTNNRNAPGGPGPSTRAQIRAFSTQPPGLFSDMPPASEMRPVITAPRMPAIGQGDARGGFQAQNNTLHSIPETEVRTSAPQFGMVYPPVVPEYPRIAPHPYMFNGMPYPPGTEHFLPQNRHLQQAYGNSMTGSPGKLHVPKQRGRDENFEQMNETFRNPRIYGFERGSSSRQQRHYSRQFLAGDENEPNSGVRRQSAPRSSTRGSSTIGSRRTSSVRYSIGPSGQLVRTPVNEPVGLAEASQDAEQRAQPQEDTFTNWTYPSGPDNNFSVTGGLINQPVQVEQQGGAVGNGSDHSDDTGIGQQETTRENVFRATSAAGSGTDEANVSLDNVSTAAFSTSADTVENDENDENIAR
ncbi:hypothetical protein TWF481_000170 [Arthrobotrys musiformis]|uniref:Uncharacterized protein n=1 Tax=Arthrobotrys musiformis TaxID=47236 RepID=A0AAV9WMQ1_9PEZI